MDNRFRALSDRYKTASYGIRAELDKEAKGSARARENELNYKIGRVLAGLVYYTEDWTAKNIPDAYRDGMSEATERVARQYAAAGRQMRTVSSWTAADDYAVATTTRSVNAHLTDAIAQTRQFMTATVRRAAQRATEEAIYKGQEAAIMRDNLIEMLEKQGIQSVSYLRNGAVCHMQLDTYAELVSRTTETEIRNIAALNLGYRIDNDLVEISEHWGSCPICAPYQGRVYSVSGNDPRYPYLYDTPWDDSYQNFHPNCAHVLTQYIEELHDPEENEDKERYSNRSFEIGGEGWTPEQTNRAEKSLEAYRARQDQNRRIYDNRKQYQRYKEALGKDAPKSFAGFVRMKSAGGESWVRLQEDYRDANMAIRRG